MQRPVPWHALLIDRLQCGPRSMFTLFISLSDASCIYPVTFISHENRPQVTRVTKYYAAHECDVIWTDPAIFKTQNFGR